MTMMNPAYRTYLNALLDGYPATDDAAAVRRFLDWADDPGRQWAGQESAPLQPSWDQYGDAMGCYAPGAVAESTLCEIDVDPGKVPDVDRLLGTWASYIWDHVCDTDVLGDSLVEALELEGIHDPGSVSAERVTTSVADPADPLGLSMGDGVVSGAAR